MRNEFVHCAFHVANVMNPRMRFVLLCEDVNFTVQMNFATFHDVPTMRWRDFSRIYLSYSQPKSFTVKETFLRIYISKD